MNNFDPDQFPPKFPQPQQSAPYPQPQMPPALQPGQQPPMPAPAQQPGFPQPQQPQPGSVPAQQPQPGFPPQQPIQGQQPQPGFQPPMPAQQPQQGIFGKIANATVSQSGVYPAAGTYPCLYVSCLKIKQKRNQGDTLAIAELEVIQSQVQERPIGSKMTWMANITKHDAAPGNILAFLMAITGYPQDQITEQMSKFCFGETNPCKGRLVHLVAVDIETRAGGTFTVCNWTQLGDDWQAQAEQLRTQAGCPAH